MRSLAAIVLAGTVFTTGAFASESSALAPGKPAGVKEANLSTAPTGLVVFGVAIVAAGIALIASASDANNSIAVTTTIKPPPTTTTTTTTTTH